MAEKKSSFFDPFYYMGSNKGLSKTLGDLPYSFDQPNQPKSLGKQLFQGLGSATLGGVGEILDILGETGVRAYEGTLGLPGFGSVDKETQNIIESQLKLAPQTRQQDPSGTMGVGSIPLDTFDQKFAPSDELQRLIGKLEEQKKEKQKFDKIESEPLDFYEEFDPSIIAPSKTKAEDPIIPEGDAPEDQGLPSEEFIDLNKKEKDSDEEENSPEANLLKAGIDAYKNALGETPKVGTLAEYKKDFAEATGIDVSGKVDKSSALMALGLALMQNKAGKGFNVGNMLSAVGEAGTKALPKLDAAKREAKAGKLAAGKYALSERARDRQALVARNKDIANKIFEISKMEYTTDKSFELQKLKEIQSLNEIALQNDAALAEAAYNDAKDSGKLGELKTIKIPGLSKEDDVTYQAQQVGDSDTFRIQNPTGLLRSINGKYKGAQGGLKTVQIMKEAAMSGETTGYKGIFNNLSSMFKGGVSQGIDPESDIQSGMNETEAYRRATGKLLIEFRKLLTGGEAGNAISDKDVAIIEENLGKTDFISFKSTAEILGAIEGIESIFSKRAQMYGDQKTSYLEALTNSGQIGGISKPLLEDFGKAGDYTDDFIAYIPELVGGQLVYKLPKS